MVTMVFVLPIPESAHIFIVFICTLANHFTEDNNNLLTSFFVGVNFGQVVYHLAKIFRFERYLSAIENCLISLDVYVALPMIKNLQIYFHSIQQRF